MTQPIAKVAIVGRDADAWITALLLKNVLANNRSSIEVQLVELPSGLSEHEFFSVLPNYKILHNALGANENVLMKVARGYFSYGQRFVNWSGASSAYMHAYDRKGIDFHGIDFFQFWLKATAQGLQVPLEEFSLGAVAAKQSRHVIFDEIPSTLSHASYGYNLSGSHYVRTIAKAAIKSGITHAAGTIAEVAVSDGQIESLVLDNGTRIDADFFIDASGSDAILMKKVEQDNVESWSKWFMCDRVILASAKPLQPRPTFNQVAAFAQGWVGLYPLLDRTAVSISYSSSYADAHSVLKTVTALSGLAIVNPVETKLDHGCRLRPWVGNCLAVGSTVVNTDCIDATYLHLLHVGLSMLRNLFPKTTECAAEASIYNKQMAEFVSGVRDFQLTHFAFNKRVGEPFWDQQRNVILPESLVRKVELFKARGIVGLEENDSFSSESWTSVLLGHGLMPTTYNPLVDKMPEEEMKSKFQQLLTHIQKEVSNMPSVESHFEMSVL